MEIMLWVVAGLMLNMVAGAGVCVLLDTDEKFNDWIARDYTGFVNLIFIQLWPVTGFLMWRYKRRINL